MQDEQAIQGHPVAEAGAPSAGAGQAHPALAAQVHPVPGPPTQPAPLSSGHPATGESRVDAALAGLGQLAGLPVAEHPAVFEQVHRQLREVLGELDSGAAGPGPAGGAGRPGR
jgi:hypothetical protein